MSFVKNFVEQLKNKDTKIMSDGTGAAEFAGYIDTGSYILNALLSGSLYGGIPDNKIIAFAGEEATGKTFFALGIVKHHLDQNPENVVVYYDTEAAVTKKMMEERGIDPNRIILYEPRTIQDFRTHVLDVVENYKKLNKKDRPKMIMVLDSLGMLSTSKELADTAAGSETKDMTRASLIRATFRVITLALADVNVPMILTNHVYAAVGAYIPTKEVSGGGGLKYAASIIAMLSKKKDKDGANVVGNIITVKLAKSRLTKENSRTEVKLSYKTGLSRYYGLLDLAEKYNIIKKVSTRYELPDGTKVWGKDINLDPEKYFTSEVMERLEKAAKEEYSYGGDVNDEMSDEELEQILDLEDNEK